MQFLVVDANVLIDFCKTQSSLLTLVSRHVGTIHVASPVLDEVHELDAERAHELGLVIVTPELAMVRSAALSAKHSPLHFQDWICLLLAEEQSWICVTNDKRLRSECETRNVPVMWEFQLLLELVKCRALTAEDALAAANAIAGINRRIPATVVAAFAQKLIELK